MIGRTYLERGEPVTVLIRWGPGGGPRNVLIQRTTLGLDWRSAVIDHIRATPCAVCKGYKEIVTRRHHPGGNWHDIITPCPLCQPPADKGEEVPW